MKAELKIKLPEQPNHQLELEQEKIMIEKEKNALKAKELEIKAHNEEAKNALTAQEMKFQAGLKIQQLADERKKYNRNPVVIHDKQPIPPRKNDINTNISTGLVKGFC